MQTTHAKNALEVKFLSAISQDRNRFSSDSRGLINPLEGRGSSSPDPGRRRLFPTRERRFSSGSRTVRSCSAEVEWRRSCERCGFLGDRGVSSSPRRERGARRSRRNRWSTQLWRGERGAGECSGEGWATAWGIALNLVRHARCRAFSMNFTTQMLTVEGLVADIRVARHDPS